MWHQREVGAECGFQQIALAVHFDLLFPGLGTTVEDRKQKVEVNGKSYLLEAALRANFALVQAFLADYLGNLSYALTARNFNPVMAMAGDTVIVSADNIVPVGVISPDHVVTPAPIVDYLIANS